MALTRQLIEDESAEPRIHCSSEFHHPRNSQLWVTGRLLLCGREISDSLHCSVASLPQRGILFNANAALINASEDMMTHNRGSSTHFWLCISQFFLSLFLTICPDFAFFLSFSFQCFFFIACKDSTTCSLCSSQQHFEGSCWHWYWITEQHLKVF